MDFIHIHAQWSHKVYMFHLLQSSCKGSITWCICILLSIVRSHTRAAQTLKQPALWFDRDNDESVFLCQKLKLHCTARWMYLFYICIFKCILPHSAKCKTYKLQVTVIFSTSSQYAHLKGYSSNFVLHFHKVGVLVRDRLKTGQNWSSRGRVSWLSSSENAGSYKFD